MKDDFSFPQRKPAPPAGEPVPSVPNAVQLPESVPSAENEPVIGAEAPAVDAPQQLAEPGPQQVAPLLRRKQRIYLWLIAALLALLLAIAAGAVGWYQLNLRPVSSDNPDTQSFEVVTGDLPDTIASNLRSAGLIRSELALSVYARMHDSRNLLQAGSYSLSPAMSLPEIVTKLVEGKTDSFTITFYPGATLYDPTDIADEQRTDVYTMLRRAGFTEDETTAAIEADYDHPVFAGRPDSEGLEGYVYGETYSFGAGTSAREVLEHTFDTLYEAIKANDIESKVKSRGLTLYQAITMASIVEREVSNIPEDQRKVAQVFYTRLEMDMPLGADATFKYVAQQRNVPAAIDIESDYNTRINAGLPPGPISAPGLNALKSVADPASTDYVYFVSGDDGKNYFAKTNAEHEENTRKYCTDLCELP